MYNVCRVYSIYASPIGRKEFFVKTFRVVILVAFAALMSGCAVIGGSIAYGVAESAAKDFAGAVEVGDIKTAAGANIALLKSATMSSVVFNQDMTAPNATPRPSDTRVNAVVTEEARRSLSMSGNSSSVVIHIKTFYFDEGYPWGYYYWGRRTEKDTLSYYQKTSVRKAVNIHLTVERENDVLLEVHGLWGGNDQADEIAGARQLAKEVAGAVLKKLESPASVKKE